MTFLQGALDLFTGVRVSHMGSYQYVGHAALRDGKPMSGAKLWAEIEASELSANRSNLFSTEKFTLKEIAADIRQYLPAKTPILELGPGTSLAFQTKTLLLLRALQSNEYIFVDESRTFLNQILADKTLVGLNVKPIEDDFFEDEYCYHDNDDEALVCMFGGTIGNIVSPLSDQAPQSALIENLRKLSRTTNKGWLLISFDSDQNGERIKAFYEKQALFQLNTFDRMAAELSINGNFDPKAFDYQADWNPHSGQLSHMAILNQDLNFTLADRKISLLTNQRLHLKNSYKFSPEFFEACCNRANLKVMKIWGSPSSTMVYLLKKSVFTALQAADATLKYKISA